MSAPAASIALHAVVNPALDQLKNDDFSAAAALESIRTALEKAESHNPGITHDFVDYLLENAQLKFGKETTSTLLLAADKELDQYRFDEKTEELKQLATRARELKDILSKIPTEVQNRTNFLGTIRKIAEAIKEVLDAVNSVVNNNKDLLASRVEEVQQQRKAFVRGSKSFSDTLKRYFKEGKTDVLFWSAHRLINQTNSLLRTIKNALEP